MQAETPKDEAVAKGAFLRNAPRQGMPISVYKSGIFGRGGRGKVFVAGRP